MTPPTEQHPSPWIHRPAWLMSLAILFVFLLIRLEFRTIPLERDEGLYVYTGQLLLQGKVPYVDFYEMKPPGLFYSYAALNAISGGSIIGMHVWMALLVTLGGWFLFRLVADLFDAEAAVLSVLSYAVLMMSMHASGYSIQADHLVVFFALAGIWSLYKGVHGGIWWRVLLGGALLCWSTLVKQNGAAFALFGAALIVVHHWGHGGGRMRKDLLLLAAGALLPLGAFAVMMAGQGNLDEFLFWTTEYPKIYVQRVGWTHGLDALQGTLHALCSDHPIAWTSGCMGLALLWSTSIERRTKIMVTIFVGLAMLSVAPGLRFYGHYFLLFMPALAIGTGAGWFFLRRWSPLQRLLTNDKRRMMLVGGMLAVTLITNAGYYFHPDLVNVLREVYGSKPFPEARALSERVMRDYRPGDGLVVIGSEPEIYAYTHAGSPSRHIYLAVMVQGHPLEPVWREELLRDLKNKPPRYMVWVQHETSWSPVPGVDQTFLRSCWELMLRDYVPVVWYEHTARGVMDVVTGERARTYEPRSPFYIMLAERKSSPIAPPPASVPGEVTGAPPTREGDILFAP